MLIKEKIIYDLNNKDKRFLNYLWLVYMFIKEKIIYDFKR